MNIIQISFTIREYFSKMFAQAKDVGAFIYDIFTKYY